MEKTAEQAGEGVSMNEDRQLLGPLSQRFLDQYHADHRRPSSDTVDHLKEQVLAALLDYRCTYHQYVDYDGIKKSRGLIFMLNDPHFDMDMDRYSGKREVELLAKHIARSLKQ